MQKTLYVRATPQSGNRIETVDQELTEGESVDVTISPAPATSARSAWQIISEGPGQRLFKTPQEVDDYIAEERASWDQ